MKTQNNIREVLDLLNQALQLEYTMIVHYPYIVRGIKNNEIKNLAFALGEASIAHANIVSNAIKSLGGSPQYSFESPPDLDDLKKVFQDQLVKEKLALELHHKSAQLIRDYSLMQEFTEIARQEESHILTVQKILSLLDKPAG